jgi:predicted secreted hydrolase
VRWAGPALAAVLALAGCGRPSAPDQSATLGNLLGPVPGTEFRSADATAAIQFPIDHGPHPDTRIEWWYFTGNLRDADQRRFGVQLALFRFALRPESEAGGDDWSSGQLYMRHLAVSDLDTGRFVHDERLERAALGLAGASSEPWRVWLPRCEARSETPSGLFPLRLNCDGEGHDGRFGIDLLLDTEAGPALHGDAGYSRKSAAPGAASHYYSFPRLRARGEISLGQGSGSASVPIPVSGPAWMDHEWGSAVLADDQAGWDWFSVQLDDGHSLMFFHIRDRAGQPVAARGSLIGPDGRVLPFAEGTIDAQPTAWWRSPHSGARYPIAWTLHSQSLNLRLEIAARHPGQELRTRVRYWEGSIEARGSHQGRSVAGEGFLELTGY